MRRLAVVILVILAGAAVASAQVSSPTQDVLGAHNVYGRGCIACHAPHSGAAGNGGPSSPNSGNLALWGEDLTPLYGQTLTFAGGAVVSIPNYNPTNGAYVHGVAPTGLPSSAGDGTFIIAACLSCHDGNIAKVGMMTGRTYETVTINGAMFNPPTLLGNDGSTPGNYLNDHPVGPDTNPGCGGPYNWDCTVQSDGTIVFSGIRSSAFLSDYFDVTKYGPLANLVVPAGGGGTKTVTLPNGITWTDTTDWVTCTTCHDQHDMLYFNAGPTVGIKPTHFFVRGWYNPGNSMTSNSAAQFCRSCHGGESNEMHGQDVPTS
jgi:cytochrome c553